MGRRLNTRVVVRDPDTALNVVLGPDDTVPDWALDVITNPNVWAADETADSDGAGERPPTAGPGSGRDAWVAYAKSKDVDVTDDMTRADIIAALPDEE